MGCKVEWDDGIITLTRGSDKTVIDTSSSKASSDGTVIDMPVIIDDGTSYVPLRKTAELFGCET